MKRCCTRPKRLTQGAPHATPTAGQLGVAHATSSPWLAALLTLTPLSPAGPSDSSAFAVESPPTPPCSCGEAQRAAAEGQSCRMPVSTARSALPPLLTLALTPALPAVPAITVLGPDGATQRVDPIDAPLYTQLRCKIRRKPTMLVCFEGGSDWQLLLRQSGWGPA